MMSGKKAVILFYGSFLLMALASIWLVIWLKSRPIVEREQRIFSMLMGNAYQKYRIDKKIWPKNAEEAAIEFRDEKPDMPEMVKKAEQDWEMRVEMDGEDTGSPMLIIRFEKPQHQEMRQALNP